MVIIVYTISEFPKKFKRTKMYCTDNNYFDYKCLQSTGKLFSIT